MPILADMRDYVVDHYKDIAKNGAIVAGAALVTGLSVYFAVRGGGVEAIQQTDTTQPTGSSQQTPLGDVLVGEGQKPIYRVASYGECTGGPLEKVGVEYFCFKDEVFELRPNKDGRLEGIDRIVIKEEKIPAFRRVDEKKPIYEEKPAEVPKPSDEQKPTEVPKPSDE